MNAYLVRLTENREIVGFFVCERADLARHVDQCTDPGTCEYAVAGAGGVYWPYAAPLLPLTSDEDWDALEGVTYCEQWSEKLYSDALTWKAVIGG